MSLRIGQQVQADTTKSLLTVKEKLGEGGQGTVYRVEGPLGFQALKWYNAEQATEGQRKAIGYLVNSGPPRGPAGRRFVWPIDLVTADGARQFGYLMPEIDKRRFADLGEVWARRKPVPGLGVLCEISYQLVLEQAYPGGPGGWEFRKNSKSFGVFRGFKRCVDSSTPGPTRDFE